jgi:predicted kinase
VARPEQLERLLRLAAALEEAIIVLELKPDARLHERTIVRLRVMQGEILGLLHRVEGDSLPID